MQALILFLSLSHIENMIEKEEWIFQHSSGMA